MPANTTYVTEARWATRRLIRIEAAGKLAKSAVVLEAVYI